MTKQNNRVPVENVEGVGLGVGLGQNTEATLVKSRNMWVRAIIQFSKNKMALISFIGLMLIIIFALLGPYFSPYSYSDIDYSAIMAPPSAHHWFGTDASGRDLFVRVCLGIKISLLVGLVGTVVSFFIGTTYGIISGYFGGKIDTIMMRSVDILYALPFMFFVIILMVYFGRSILFIFVAIGAVQWLTMARIVRGETLRVKQLEFVKAARAIGASRPRILFRHVFPSLLGTIITYITLTIPQVIIIESFLSFLGLGVQEPLASLGSLISNGAQNIQQAVWMVLFPAIFLSTFLLFFNFIGDGLRDAFDPKDY